MQPTNNVFKNRVGDHLAVGAYGEALALEYLMRLGYRIVATNFVTPIGYSMSGRAVTGEIDIIGYDERIHPFTLAFIEVKTRTSTNFTSPHSAVDRQKQRHIIKAARIYRRLLRLTDAPFRYDVVSIVLPPQTKPQIQLLPGYFTEQVYANSRWHQRTW